MNIESDRKSVGQRIFALRKKNNETQKTLAEIISATPNTISKLENGEIGLTFENMLLIAEHYNVSLDYLCKGIGGDTLLATLNKFVRLRYSQYSGLDETDATYNIPKLEINEKYYDYLVQTASANANSMIPKELREQWILIESQKFDSYITSNGQANFIPLIPFKENDVLRNNAIVSALIKSKL